MSKPKNWIPPNWTFKSKAVASRFDKHVREQLPWYDLVTSGVEHIARHYVGEGGLVYDIGASTGNIGRALAPLLQERRATLVGVESSAEMVARYDAPGECIYADATTYEYTEGFDFGVLFLVIMFMPVAERLLFVERLRAKLAPGGALVVVDKVNTPSGYAGTCLRRMAMRWKLANGATPDEIIKKELSLEGHQRPLDEREMDAIGTKWFKLGEFAGWIIEK